GLAGARDALQLRERSLVLREPYPRALDLRAGALRGERSLEVALRRRHLGASLGDGGRLVPVRRRGVRSGAERQDERDRADHRPPRSGARNQARSDAVNAYGVVGCSSAKSARRMRWRRLWAMRKMLALVCTVVSLAVRVEAREKPRRGLVV